jgi:hypothetical protein
MLQKEEAAAAAVSSTGMSDVVERRHRRGVRWRRRSFAVPRPSGEAQEAGVQRKKKALWG